KAVFAPPGHDVDGNRGEHEALQQGGGDRPVLEPNHVERQAGGCEPEHEGRGAHQRGSGRVRRRALFDADAHEVREVGRRRGRRERVSISRAVRRRITKSVRSDWLSTYRRSISSFSGMTTSTYVFSACSPTRR